MAGLKGFGKRLKNSVKKSPYTQKQLSEMLSLNQDTFSNYVKEIYYPKADTLLELCTILDISVDWLLSGEGAPRRRGGESLPEADFSDLTDYEKELMYHYRLLSERGQGRVDQFVISMTEEETQNS
ncbi:MAG: helix-turn-helix transcriptional regulator [Peptococcaceae bacterium]|nr:helix-turn-helix transcriptional regulator [Peptococcaceae bacterium]